MELWQLDIVGGIWLADGCELKAVTGIDDHSRFCVMAGLSSGPMPAACVGSSPRPWPATAPLRRPAHDNPPGAGGQQPGSLAVVTQALDRLGGDNDLDADVPGAARSG
jgi:hypothetical protein